VDAKKQRDFQRNPERADASLRLSVLRRNLAKFAHDDVFVEGLRKAGVPE
jgi:adenylate cyclase